MYVWFRLFDKKKQKKNKERKEERTEGNKEKVNKEKESLSSQEAHTSSIYQVLNQISVLKVVSNHPAVFRERHTHDFAGYQVQLR